MFQKINALTKALHGGPRGRAPTGLGQDFTRMSAAGGPRDGADIRLSKSSGAPGLGNKIEIEVIIPNKRKNVVTEEPDAWAGEAKKVMPVEPTL